MVELDIDIVTRAKPKIKARQMPYYTLNAPADGEQLKTGHLSNRHFNR